MKIRFLGALIAITFALPAFAQQKDTVDPKIDQQIRALAAKFDQAFNKHDPAAVAALYTQDAVGSFSNKASHGRQAIEKSYATDFHRWNAINRVTTVDRVIAVGNEVRSIGRWSDTPHGDQEATNNEGYYSWIMAREGDTWKIRRSTFSESMIHPGGSTWYFAQRIRQIIRKVSVEGVQLSAHLR